MAGNSRNLVVLSDGTGNSASTPFKTNVWRLYQALKLRDGSQIAVFADGVGTSSIKMLRVIGLALGFGVKRNVLTLYKFLCRNYWHDETDNTRHDKIWMFGFSRGAFTIRVLAGLIDSQGLVSCRTEAELEQNAVAAYRAYRAEAFKTQIPWVCGGRWIRDRLMSFWRSLTGGASYSEIQQRTLDEGRRHVPIHFIGVWDTVVAYGLPIDELTIAVDKWVWPMKFRETSLLKNVRHGRHALSLDDERRTFHPVPWCEVTEGTMARKAEVPDDRLLQVWFPGMHADVGGGYPDDGLAYVPLCWMMDEAKALGLAFEGDIFDTYRALAAPTGRMYDSRGGSGALWRYQPRNVEVLMNKKIRPLVHHCVITRMMSGNDGYAPFSLPLGVSILLPDRTRVSFDMQGVANARAATKRKTAGAKPEELPALKDTENVLADLGAVVQASAKLPRDDYFALVLDTVWIRRIVYFVTLILALTALAYPVLYEILDFGDNTEKLDDITSGFLVYVIALVKGFVPSFATPWLDAISANGLGAVIIGVLFVLSLALSTFLQRRIHDRARAAWNVQRTGPKADRLKPTGQRHALLTLTMIGAVLTGFTIPVANDNKYLLATIAIFTVVFFALYLYRRIRPSGAVDPSHPRFPLSLARSLRTSPRWVSRYRWVAQTLAPILFIAAVGYLALCVVNLTAFNVASTVGGLCPDIPDAQQPAGTRPDPKIAPRTPQQLADAAQEEILTGVKTIDVRSLCHPTGLKLVAGRQYRIRLETQKEWFDKSIPVDVAGFSTDGIRHALASPLKRWWREKWFQPIARVGLYGNYEYPLKPAAPLAEANFSQCPKPPESKAFPVALAEGIAGFVKALLNPGKIIDDVRDIPKQASSETIAAQLACERDPVNDIRRAKVLIADITPGHSGELFIYVNDAVIAWPGLTRLFYNNNTGTADVSVTRTVAPATVDFTADRPAKWEPTQSKK